MMEFAERRAALGCGPRSSRKRRRLHGPGFANGESALQLKLDRADDEVCATRVMVFGTDASWPEIGCVSFLPRDAAAAVIADGSLIVFVGSSTTRTR